MAKLRRWLRYTAVAVAILVGVAAVFLWLCDPPLEESKVYPGGAVLRDASGEVIRVTLGDGDVDCRPWYQADQNDWVVKALVAAEDRWFFSHHGVNPISALRAVRLNTSQLRRVSGASTITMQTVRLIKPHPRNLWWKILESFYALRLDFARDKLWIVSQYLNRAPFGSNLIGVEAAAQGWLGKSAKSLTIGEAALLAGMVQSPSRFRPDRRLERALKRREYVLDRMEALGMITAEQREFASASRPEIKRSPRPFAAPFFCDWWLAEHGSGPTNISADVVTTLDPDIQRLCERHISTVSDCSAAVVIRRVSDGAVVAMACSDDYFGRKDGQVNTAAAPRPVGSTLKPFLTAMAIDGGLVTPSTRFIDAPKSYHGYNPRNFDGAYMGPVKVADALERSLNMPFVQMLNEIGVREFTDVLHRLGLSGIDGRRSGLSLAIGTVDVSLVDMTGAYAALASPNGGGVFSPAAAWMVSDMLSGDGRAAAVGLATDVKSSRFAWKTGTSSACRDAWTFLWNPEWVVGVWCGHKRGAFGDNGIVGIKAAAPMAWRIARALYPANDGPWFSRPPEVVERTVCSLSGAPATSECPSLELGLAVSNVSSTAVCPRHRIGDSGKVEVIRDAEREAERLKQTRRLVFAQPRDGTEFHIVEGIARQRVVCRVNGNRPDGKLWWFVDNCPIGETIGAAPFLWTPEPGAHRISCSTETGVSAGIDIKVVDDM